MSHAHKIETVTSWLERILGHEGGYSDDYNDPGNWTSGHVGTGQLKGTKWGIAANTYPYRDIKNLTKEDAAEIYQEHYLKPLKANNYQDGVAFQLLDFAINSGIRRARRSFQKAVGAYVDGYIGAKTLAKAAQYSESDLIMRVIAVRIDFMTSLKNWKHHGKGWVRRLANNLRYGSIDS